MLQIKSDTISEWITIEHTSTMEVIGWGTYGSNISVPQSSLTFVKDVPQTLEHTPSIPALVPVDRPHRSEYDAVGIIETITDVALIYRGGSFTGPGDFPYFTNKLNYAQDATAVAAIIINNKYDDELLSMGPASTSADPPTNVDASSITIPGFFVTFRSILPFIKDLVLQQNNVQVRYIQSPTMCFRKGSQVLINNIRHKNIEDIQRGDHINQNKVVGVVSQQLTGKIVKITKNAIAFNVPSVDTFVTHDHKLHHKNLTFLAKNLINGSTVIEEDVNETVYNVLLDNFIYDKMKVNNIICETLHPLNTRALAFYKTYAEDQTRIGNNTPQKLYEIALNRVSQKDKKLYPSELY
tara:strand:+ start:7155 stop:8213 length:1059 start_codon:yes stop_codon:yes gene_type:complete